ncbi:MAG: adenylyl-sulfate kinase [Candidatus Diapherotrites archaeon]
MENNNQIYFTLWFTGLPCSGKSTIAEEIKKELLKRNLDVDLLDGDIIRENISKDLGFTKKDIIENNRRVMNICKTLNNQNKIAIVAIVSPFEETRKLAKKTIPNYAEIFVDCPVKECIKRDTKGLYRKALNNEIENFIGIHVKYEPPQNPDLKITTIDTKLDNNVKKILEKLVEKKYLI